MTTPQNKKIKNFDIAYFRYLYKLDEEEAINYLELKIKELKLDNLNARMIFRFISWSRNLLSENFMEKFKDSLNWMYLTQYQKMSLDFLIKHNDKIVVSWLEENKKINKNIKNKFISYIKLIK
jgi:hypothetical protein